jgi:hypothetical protein
MFSTSASVSVASRESFAWVSRTSGVDDPRVKSSPGNLGSAIRTAIRPSGATSNALALRKPPTTRLTAPPPAGILARWDSPLSSRRKKMSRPSGE